MTVAELIEILRTMPQDLEIYVFDCHDGCGPTNEVQITLASVYGTPGVVIAVPDEED